MRKEGEKGDKMKGNRLDDNSSKKRGDPASRHVDRRPHEVFVQLNELVWASGGGGKEEGGEGAASSSWRETARWIKFEESFEVEAARWGKPRVSSLSFRSLLELRKILARGVVHLDVAEATLPGVAARLTQLLAASAIIRARDRDPLLRALNQRHSLPCDCEPAAAAFLRSGLGSLRVRASSWRRGAARGETGWAPGSAPGSPGRGPPPGATATHRDVEAAVWPKRSLTFTAADRRPKLLEKIPHGAEATLVLVGHAEFLAQPAAAFVRLRRGVVLPGVLEVPVPTRFVFLLLGPRAAGLDYHEMGRSLAALMSDKDFHDTAYRADDRRQLLGAINEFLDSSVLLPPAELSDHELLGPVPSFQRSVLHKRRQRRSAADEDNQKPSVDGKAPAAEASGGGGDDDDPLRRTGVPFGGVWCDIKRRYGHYASDLRDALNVQCLPAMIFIYFAALSPCITFGGLLGEATGNLMGVSELVVATSTQGVLFALLGAQPLLIIGFSGPLLVFEEAFFSFCESNSLDYLTGRVWVGLWLVLLVLVLVAAEGSFLVRYVSRFTQEIFAFLISLIFIYETFEKIYEIFQDHPLLGDSVGGASPPAVAWNSSEAPGNSSASLGATACRPAADEDPRGCPNTALMSLVFMASTFFIAVYLRKFKNSRFLPGVVRRAIGDFGVAIAIIAMVLISLAVKTTYLQKLVVPSGVSLSEPSQRGWFISPAGPPGRPFPVWMMFAAAIPGALVLILVFMETQITTLILAKKERRLVKGSGFHLDLLLIALMGGASALLGLPWLTAATVRSVSHANALTVMSRATAPGERPRTERVLEQRLTALAVALLVGLSVVLGDVLSHIPLAVLFGVFLYMGVTSLSGVRMVERMLLALKPTKYHPERRYVTAVKTWRMNMFTAIQVLLLAVLWAVQLTPAALAFPFLLILTVPCRWLLLPRIFSAKELQALDGEESEPTFNEEEGQDEYDELAMPV